MHIYNAICIFLFQLYIINLLLGERWDILDQNCQEMWKFWVFITVFGSWVSWKRKLQNCYTKEWIFIKWFVSWISRRTKISVKIDGIYKLWFGHLSKFLSQFLNFPKFDKKAGNFDPNFVESEGENWDFSVLFLTIYRFFIGLCLRKMFQIV
jgi:hypothetical protein